MTGHFVEFIKTYFLHIACVVIALCLTGVAVYNCTSSKRQKVYRVAVRTYGVCAGTDTVETRGVPQVTRYRRYWEMTDYDGVVRRSRDSMAIVGITVK